MAPHIAGNEMLVALTDHGHGEALAREWDGLAERMHAIPFQRPGWVYGWWKAFGRGRLDLLTVRNAQRLVGILPLVRRGGLVRSPANYHTPLYGPVVEDERAGALLAKTLLSLNARRMDLGFLGVDDSLLALSHSAAAARGHRVLIRTLMNSPYLTVDGDWHSYERQLGKGRRGDLRRCWRRLNEAGGVSVEVATGEERLDQLLEEGFQVEASGWKGEHRTAIHSNPQTRQFYTDVARWAATRGWLRLAFLRLDGRAIAFDYSLEQGAVHYLIKTGFDTEYRSLGPGMLMRHRMLARAFRLRLASYEFLGDVEPWKSAWTDTVRPRVLWQSFPPSPLGWAQWSSFKYGRPLAKRLLETLRPTLGR
jgi:CelD/BcsL family acetyltransferase involved in cellulose biosynthesis